MKPKHSSPRTNEPVLKCCFTKAVIFSSDALVAFLAHVSLGIAAIPDQSRAGRALGLEKLFAKHPAQPDACGLQIIPCTARQEQLPIPRCVPRCSRAAASRFSLIMQGLSFLLVLSFRPQHRKREWVAWPNYTDFFFPESFTLST